MPNFTKNIDMKRLLIICICLLGFVATSFDLSAQDNNSGNSQGQTARLHIPSSNPHRPRVPARTWIDCTYQDGQLMLSSNETMEGLELYFTEEATDMVTYYYIPVTEQPVSAMLKQGTYYIVCVVQGVRYEGELDIFY